MATEAAQLYSVQNAQLVAESLLHFIRKRPDDYLGLEMVSYDNGKEILHPNLFIKLDSQGGKTTLADGSEIAHCHTDDGRKIDIMLGRPAERELQPATIIVEQQ